MRPLIFPSKIKGLKNLNIIFNGHLRISRGDHVLGLKLDIIYLNFNTILFRFTLILQPIPLGLLAFK